MEKLYRVQMNKNGMPDFSTAVEVEPCKDAVSREWLLNELEEMNVANFYEANFHSNEMYGQMNRMIKAAPSVTVEPKKVCIGQIHFDDEKLHEIVDEAMKKLKEEIEPKHGEDTVSKAWVKENMLKYGFKAPDMTVTEFIEDAPSVMSKPKHGENIGTDYAECDQFICSECGIHLQGWVRIDEDDYDEGIVHEYEFRFCPNCGVKMMERSR